MQSIPSLGSLRSHLFAIRLFWNPLKALEYVASPKGIVQFSVGRQPWMLITHPTLIHEILVEHANDFSKPPMLKKTRALMGNGLVTSDGEHHKRQRRILGKAFTPSTIDDYSQLIRDVAERYVETWTTIESINFSSALRSLTLEVIGETMFGVSFDREFIEERNVFLNEGKIAMDSIRPFRLHIDATGRFQQAKKRLDECVARLIQHGMNRKGEHLDLLSQMLRSTQAVDDDNVMNYQQLHDEIITLIIAGHETVTHALEWTLLLLSNNPACREKLQRELMDGAPGITCSKGASFHVPGSSSTRLSYLEAVILESMRIRPPIWVMGRHADKKDVRLSTGIEIPKGTAIAMSQWVVHRDPNWFSRPNEFRPERWIEFETEDQQKQQEQAFFPFGLGRRKCIGDHLAIRESAIVLQTLLSNHDLELDRTSRRVAPRAGFTLSPSKPICGRILRRKCSQ